MSVKSQFKSTRKRDMAWSTLIHICNLPKPTRQISEALSRSGDSRWSWLALLIWLVGNLFWNHWALTVELCLALLLLVVLPIRKLVDRRRPIGFWSTKTCKKSPEAFPSGHASRSFLLAALPTGFGPFWVAVLFWIWAPLVALSRVSMGMHFPSEVIDGLVLALIVGLLWLHFHDAALQFLVLTSLPTCTSLPGNAACLQNNPARILSRLLGMHPLCLSYGCQVLLDMRQPPLHPRLGGDAFPQRFVP